MNNTYKIISPLSIIQAEKIAKTFRKKGYYARVEAHCRSTSAKVVVFPKQQKHEHARKFYDIYGCFRQSSLGALFS